MSHRPYPLPNLSQSSRVDFFKGFLLPFQALKLILRAPRLTLLTLAVSVVTAACLVGLFAGLWHGCPALVARFFAPHPGFWAGLAQRAITVVLFAVCLVIGANVLPPIFTAPLIDPISVQTERLFGFPSTDDGSLQRMAKEIIAALLNSIKRSSILLAGHALLLLLLLIPVVGGPAWTALSWLWTTTCLAISYLDVPMARHLYRFRHELRILKNRFSLCLGFGTAISLMLWIPLLNFFFVPVAVVAATVLFRALIEAGDIPAVPSAPASTKQPAADPATDVFS